MIIEQIDDPDLTSLMGFSAESQTQRSAGVHLSDIIRIIMQRLEKGRREKKYAVNFDPDARTPERIELGIAWEPVLEEALRRKYATVRPGELVSPEGIAMSPDGVNPILMCGEEYKVTWKSCREGLVDEYGMPHEKFLAWFIQMKAYALWLDVDDYLLRSFFINGNYNRSGKLKDGSPDPDGGPTLKSYLLRFTQEEKEENWQLVTHVAREEGLIP